MNYTKLSGTDTKISKTCLGTMNFGSLRDEATSYEIMDLAFEQGVNFWDTAEMYPVPFYQETYALTEKIIGRWLQSRGQRDKLVLATKILGPSRDASENFGRGDDFHFSEANIRSALEDSLQRLQTDYVDLYQLHWPDRAVNKFGQWAYEPDDDEQMTPIADVLKTMTKLRQEGKIKHFGLSNETPWGVMTFLRLADELNLDRPVSIQNNYSLLTRTYEVAMAEVSHREGIGLLAYSPLGYGILGGRYLESQPTDGRFVKYADFLPRYRTPQIMDLVRRYNDLAQKHGLSLSQMALAFCYQQFFVTSVIVGPSTKEQLLDCLEAEQLEFSPELLKKLDEIHQLCHAPCP